MNAPKCKTAEPKGASAGYNQRYSKLEAIQRQSHLDAEFALDPRQRSLEYYSWQADEVVDDAEERVLLI